MNGDGGHQLRTFVGLFPPKILSEQLFDEASRILDGCDARLVTAERYHLTLCFIGHLGGDESLALMGELRGALASLEPFDLLLGTGGVFSGSGRDTISWIGPCSSSLTALSRVRSSVRECVDQAGISPVEDDRPWHPHMTVARSRQEVPEGALEGLQVHQFGTGRPWFVQEARVAMSGPGLVGPYPELERVSLGNRARRD